MWGTRRIRLFSVVLRACKEPRVASSLNPGKRRDSPFGVLASCTLKTNTGGADKGNNVFGVLQIVAMTA
jgi:hypothetical protein